MITLSTFLSVIVVNLYFHGARQEVPRIVRKVSVLARKITHHECEGGIEKSIPRDHRLPLLVKLRNADWWSSGRICLSHPHAHDGYLYS